ncbi:MAG: serine/threonine protein kinase [Candidatus Hydrogenedentes bacterium]|nr:serine/threonine protein kinase [Candidatus Hydrogenedentota bacterium]
MSDSSMPEKLGRYTIVRELGKGAMGIVYEGKDPNIGRRVAIKTARRDVMEATGMAAEMMERFLREARAAGSLNHPNIITIYDAGEEGDMAYIAMEFLEGGDLEDVIKEKRRLDYKRIVDIGVQICEGLAVAHDEGVVHRDIKPANILMPENAPLKVADFGIAHVTDSNLTQDGTLIGTPHYMSPEQFMGQKVDGRSDLFSVGNILYELITGEKPFTGEALSTVMHNVIKTTPVPPGELNFTIPEALSEVIMIALSKKPAERYSNGRHMAAALRECLKEHPDPTVVKTGRQPNLDATIAGGGAPLGATVMTGAPDLGSTVAGAGAAMGSTVQGGAPAGMGATVAGGTPLSSTGTQTAPGLESTIRTPAKKPLPIPAIAGGVIALLAVIVGAIMMSGGEKGAETPGGAAIDTPHFASVTMKVYRAADQDTFTKYAVDEIKPEDVRALLDQQKINQVAVVLYVVNPDDKKETYSFEENYLGETLSIEDQPQRVSVEARLDAQSEEAVFEGDFTAKSAGEALDLPPIIIAPAGTS